MVQITPDEIRQNLSDFLERVQAGETVLIVQAGRTIAEVKPVTPAASTLRPVGLCAGEFTVPDDFDDPLPEDVLRASEG